MNLIKYGDVTYKRFLSTITHVCYTIANTNNKHFQVS